MGERRLERVGHLVQAEVARLLLTAVRDVRLREVTITAVRMTPDLRYARIYYRTLGDPAQHGVLQAGLEKATPFLRGEIGRALGMRVVPALLFAYDETPDTARRVEDLLRETAPSGANHGADENDDEDEAP